jgi:hypothetical protein
MKRINIVTALFVSATATLGIATPMRVEVDTSSLIGHDGAPFFINFQFIDGSGPMTKITSCGSLILTSELELRWYSDPDWRSPGISSVKRTSERYKFLKLFHTVFWPGKIFQFTLHMVPQPDVGSPPDQFSFALLDGSHTEIPTFGTGNALMIIDLSSEFPEPVMFGTDPNVLPSAGGTAITMNAPQIIPEPATNVLVGLGLMVAACIENRRRLCHQRQHAKHLSAIERRRY